MSNSVGIIDYGMGNLRSVANAFQAVGARVVIMEQPEDARKVGRIVLPGVGAFGDGMKNLRSLGWMDVLEDEVRRKKKNFLGVCLGMQILATTGTEHGLHEGFNWIPGRVLRIADPSVRVPHMGWDDVRFVRQDGLFAGLGEIRTFYFVHSYVLVPDDSGLVSGVCDYGGSFPACLSFENIHAVQFHPEKSQKAGLMILNNFMKLESLATC